MDEIIKNIKNQIEEEHLTVSQKYLMKPYYERIMNGIKKQDGIVIMGAGLYGERLYDLMREEGIADRVICFCDNSKTRQKTGSMGKKVLSVESAVERYPDAYYVITPKLYENELLRQLVHLGIPVDMICVFVYAHTGLVDG